METALRAFLDAVRTTYRSGHTAAPAPLATSLERLIEGLDPGSVTLGDLSAQEQPVCRHFSGLLDAAAEGPNTEIAPAARALAPYLHWVHRYDVDHHLPGFSENWAHAETIGPSGLARSDRIRLGLILLGPSTFYPGHHHPAVEVYHILAGTADWQLGKGPFIPRKPGEFILHPSNVAHATRTHDEPLLALFGWHGEVEKLANWCPDAF